MATTTTKKEDIVEEKVKKDGVKTETTDDKISKLTDLMTQFMQVMLVNQKSATSTSSADDRVKIIHLVERAPGLSTYMKLSNLEVKLTKFGEERYLFLQQFEEMVGKYRKWFDQGILSVAAGYEEIAERYGLKTAAEYPIDGEFIYKLGDISMAEIEMVYPKLPQAGKDFLLSYWNRKIIEGDPNFKDRRKIETLNRLSDGAMDQTIRALTLENQRKK